MHVSAKLERNLQEIHRLARQSSALSRVYSEHEIDDAVCRTLIINNIRNSNNPESIALRQRSYEEWRNRMHSSAYSYSWHLKEIVRLFLQEWDAAEIALFCTVLIGPPLLLTALYTTIGRRPSQVWQWILAIVEVSFIYLFGCELAEHVERRRNTTKFDKVYENGYQLTFAYESLNRKFCITTGGRLGMVPETANFADEVFVFSGGRVPFLLRPRTDGRYTLLGQCYIDNCMDGQLHGDLKGFEYVDII